MSVGRLFWFCGSLVMALKLDEPFPMHGAGFTISRVPLAGNLSPMSDLKITDHVVELKRGNSKAMSANFVQGMRMRKRTVLRGEGSRAAANESQLTAVEAGQVFLAPVTVGGQEFEIVIDTGSSDPWLVTPEFICANPYSGETQPQESCYFGTPYDPILSPTLEPVPDQNFNITYTDREMLNGDLAFETFTLAGITVTEQKFALVDYAAWFGDGYSSGLIGFAYGTLTSAYNGTDPTKDHRGDNLMYNPLFVNMYNRSLIPPLFSLAINRDPANGGLLALGGIPDVPHAPHWVSVSIQNVGVFIGTETPAYQFYTVTSEGFAFSSSPSTQFNILASNNPLKTPIVSPSSVIIDSGTSLVYAPNTVARGVALAFTPPGIYDSEQDAWFVSCAALPPIFGVSIGQKIFYVNGLDMIIPTAEDKCISGVQPNNGGLTILGDVWMKNVISVFDVGAAMMRFAAREFYGLTAAPIAVTT